MAEVKSLEPVLTHLEFLGYELERKEKIVLARHAKKLNLMVRSFAGGVLLTAILSAGPGAHRDRIGYLEMINGFNQEAAVVRFYADEDADLFLEAWYPDEYDRQAFGAFLELMERDHGLVFRNENAGRYLS